MSKDIVSQVNAFVQENKAAINEAYSSQQSAAPVSSAGVSSFVKENKAAINEAYKTGKYYNGPRFTTSSSTSTESKWKSAAQKGRGGTPSGARARWLDNQQGRQWGSSWAKDYFAQNGMKWDDKMSSNHEGVTDIYGYATKERDYTSGLLDTMNAQLEVLQAELDEAVKHGQDASLSGYAIDPLSASLYGDSKPYEGRSETQIKREIAFLESQIRYTQVQLGAANTFIAMWDDNEAGDKAYTQSGLNHEDWYQQSKAEAEAADQAVKAAEKALEDYKLGAGSNLDRQGGSYTPQQAQRIDALGVDLVVAQQRQKEAQQTLRWAEQRRFDSMIANPDNAVRGKANFEAYEQGWREDQSKGQQAAKTTSFGITPDPMAAGMGALMQELVFDKSYLGPDERWTEEQRQLFYSLWNNGTEYEIARAQDYARKVNAFYTNEDNEQLRQRVATSASSGFWGGLGHTAGSIVAGLMSGPEFMVDVAELAVRGEVTEKPFGLSDYNQAVQGAVTMALNDKYGDWAGDAYGIATSIAQSWAAMAMTGGSSGLITAMYFGQAAKSEFDRQIAMGRPPERAVAMGVGSGLAEALGEALSIENLKVIMRGQGTNMMLDILRSAAIEGSEEGMTTLLNTFADAIVNGDESDYHAALAGYVSQGMSYEEAARMATKDWLNGLAFDIFAGAISGGVSGGVIAPTVQTVSQMVTPFSGDSRSLVEKAQSLSDTKAETLGNRYADRLDQRGTKDSATQQRLNDQLTYWQGRTEKGAASERRAAQRKVEQIQRRLSAIESGETSRLNVHQANKLSTEITKASNEKNADSIRSSITRRLTEAGLDSDTAELAASGIWKSANGKLMTKAESKAMRSNRLGVQLRDELRNVLVEGAVDVQRITEDSPAWLQQTELTDSAGEILEAAYPEQIQQVQSALNNVIQQSELAELAAGQGEHADAIVQMFDPKSQTALDYVTAMDTAMNIEAANVSNRTAWEQSESVQYLTEEQRDYAWEQGQKQRTATQEKSQKRQREIDSRKEKAPQNAKKPAQKKDGKQGKKSGKVRSQGVEIEGKKYKAGDLKKISKAERRVLDRLSAATGVDIVFFETEAGESGRFEGANGFYRDGVVYLDINAEASNIHEKSAVLLTAAHEFTHFIREHSPAQYEALKEFVTERMLADGREFSAMVRGKMNQIVDGKKLTQDEAVEEVIADACEMVFSDSKSVEALRQKDSGLWSALKNWMHDFLADLQEAFTGVEARHESAKAMNDYISELAERFGVALAEASENAGAREESGTTKYQGRKKQDESKFQDKYYERQIRNWDGKDHGGSFRVGSPSEALLSVGIPNSDIWFDQSKAAKQLSTKEEITKDELLMIPKMLENPIAIAESYDNTVIVFGELKDEHGNPIVIAVRINSVNRRNNVTIVNKIRSIGARNKNKLDGLLEDGKILYLNPNKKETNKWFNALGRSTPFGGTKFGLIRSVSFQVPEVKQKFSLRDEVEQTTRLVAVHNKSVSGLQRMLQRGGVPFPSIAVKKAGTPHEGFGDVSIVFPRATIDPAESQWNRLYSNDAWTPTEPRTEYDVGDTYNLQRLFENMAGSEVFHALKGSSRLSSDSLERELLNNNGDVFEAVKNLSLVKYGYLQSIGQRPEGATKEKTLDGFGRYKNEQLLAIFDAIDWETIKNAGHTDNDLAQRIADVLNEQKAAKYKDKPSTFKALKAKPLYTADKINIGIIRDAYRKWEAAGRKIETELDAYDLEDALRDNKELVENEGYRRWVEDIFDGLIQESGIPNGKEAYTAAGNPRSFTQRHVPATLENIVAQMRKEQERGVGTFGIELRGAASKSYDSIEDMRAESGRLLGERIDDDVYDSIMSGFYERLSDLKTRGAKGDSWDSRDSAEQLILEAIRDKKTKRSMDSFFQKESRWFNYSKALVDDVWQLKQDVQNMPVPYFEAKPRRNVSVEEALAYIVPDSTDAKLIAEMRQRGLNVLTYKEGDSADRLAKLNSVERAQFSRRDSTEGLTKEEAREQARAYTKLKARAAKLEKQVKELKRELSKNPGKRVEPKDVAALAKELIRQYASNADTERVEAMIQELGDQFVGDSTLDYDGMIDLAQDIAYTILSESVAYEDTRQQLGEPDRIRDKIRTLDIQVSKELLAQMPEGFRKRYSGKLHLVVGKNEGASIRGAYSFLQQEFGTQLFPDMSTDAERLSMIAEMYDRAVAKPTAYNPYAAHMNESINHLGLDIVNAVLTEQLEKSPPSAMETVTTELQKTKDALEKQKKESSARIREIRAEEAAKRKQLREELTAEKWDKVKEVRAYFLEKESLAAAKRKESAAQRKYRARVYEKADTLMRWITVNSQKEHVPEAIKAPLAEFLSSINFDSKQLIKKGKQTQRDVKYTEMLRRLADVLDNQAKYQRGEGEQGAADGYVDLPAEFTGTMRQYAAMLEEHLKAGNEMDLSDPVSTMTAEQLKDLAYLLTVLETSIRNINRLHTESHFAGVEEAARSTMQELDELGRAKDRGKLTGRTGDVLAWKNSTPYYVFKRFGVAGMERFNTVVNGWAKMAMNIKAVQDFAERAYTGEEAKRWEATVKTIQLDSGRKIRMSVAQIMGLYCLSKREQGQKHIYAGGIRIADFESSKGQTVHQVESAQLTANDVARIVGLLSNRQTAVADKLQKFMSTQCAEWFNNVSMERFGYRQANEDFYYPIDTDPNSRPLNDPKARETDIFRLLNMGATKQLNPNANNAAVIHSIFDVFAAHSADAAKYDALALPLLDMLKWYNYKDRSYVEIEDAASGETVSRPKDNSVQQAIEMAFGKQAQSYFTTFIKDLNGVREGGRNEQVLKGLMGKYKAAAVGANIRVALQQPTAIARAAYLLNPKYLMQGAAMTGGIQEAMKYSGLAVWKDMGYFDVNIARGMREQIKHTETVGDRIRENGMKLAEWGDKITWGAIWNACKLETQEKTGLKGEELKQATAQRFNEVIISTQVMDSTITRSELMRGNSLAMNEVTSFMSEPTVTYNVMMDALSQYNLEKRRSGSAAKAFNKTGKVMFRAAACYVVNSALTAAAAAIADAMRDDDEYETFMDKWLEHFRENFVEGMNPLNLLPMAGDVWDMAVNFVQSGKVSAPTSMMWEPFVNVGKGMSSAWDAYQLLLDPEAEVREPNRTQWGRLYNSLQGLSSITGLPAAGFIREVKALWNVSGAVITGKTLKFYDIGAKSSIRNALQDGKLTEEEAIQELLNSGEYEDGNDAYWQVQTWLNAETEGWTKYTELYAAIEGGDKKAWEAAADELVAHGENLHELRNKTVTQVGRLVCEGEKPKLTRAQAKKILMEIGGLTQMEADHQWDEWQMKLTTGIYLKDLQDEFVLGNVSESRAVEYLIKYDHQRKLDAAAKVQEWKMEKETGIPFTRLRDAYLYGEIDRMKVVQYLQRYGGKTAAEAEEKALEMDAAIKYGVQMGSSEYGILDAYLEGYVTRNVAKEIMIFYDGKTEEEAEEYMSQYDFEKATGYAWKSGDGVQTAYQNGEIDWQDGVEWFRVASPSTHGSPEVAEELMQVVDWKINVPGSEKMNRDGVQKWNRYSYHLTNRGMGKSDFAFAWTLYMNSESQYDANGVKVKEKAEVFFDKLYQLYVSGEYTFDEINGLSRVIYGRKYITKYRKW